MSIVLLIGSHPRHAFMARAAAKAGALRAVVIEKRESHVPAPPDGLPAATRALFVRHFETRQRAEERFFGADFEAGLAEIAANPKVEVLRTRVGELNGPATAALLRRIRPEIILSYGIHIYTPEILALRGRYCWNILAGLSPWYRGVVGHFWPSYMLEPQKTGMTVHDSTEDIDKGGVIHQCAAPLVRGDGLHDLSCRAVAALGEDLPELLRRAMRGDIKPSVSHDSTSRIWGEGDWRPAHLHAIYEFYADRIVDRYLDGAFGGAPPQLVRQF